MKILVSGGSGFIGSHLVDSLVEKKHKVVVVDKLTTGKKMNLRKSISKIRFLKDDIRNFSRMDHIMHKFKPEVIFHLAAEARISECTKNPRYTNEVNVGGTINMLEMARKYKVKKFIFASSSSIYGDGHSRPICEGYDKTQKSIYALQKRTAELYVSKYAEYYKVPTMSFRYFNVYGTSRQSNEVYPTVFSSFYRDMKKKGRITIYGNGRQVRDFIHVYDLVRAHLVVLESPRRMFDGGMLNLGTGKITTVNKIAKYFDCRKVYRAERKEDVFYSCANMIMTDLSLGFESKITIDQGIKIFFNSFNKK